MKTTNSGQKTINEKQIISMFKNYTNGHNIVVVDAKLVHFSKGVGTGLWKAELFVMIHERRGFKMENHRYIFTMILLKPDPNDPAHRNRITITRRPVEYYMCVS